MKALLKSGDTERIIFYANVSRHRDIYMMAANYLQTNDWRKNPKLVEHIITYYRKAQAYDSLGTFYESAAESDIEDFHDYKKALEHYKEAESTLKELVECGTRQHEDQLRNIQSKITYISKFLLIQQ